MFVNIKRLIAKRLFIQAALVLSAVFCHAAINDLKSFPGNNHADSSSIPDSSLHAQAKIRDSICYSLNFNGGDTLEYSVESHDSIVINFGKPLLKTRHERLRVICDSVGRNSHYFLQLEQIDFHSIESTAGESEVERPESDWTGKKVFIEIDSLGRRYSYTFQHKMAAALAPGGAFAPTLFFPFDESCKENGESWFVKARMEMPENGYPIPVLRLSSLFRAKPSLDTLGERCKRFEFIGTGQGSIELPKEIDTMLITNIVQCFGVMDICSEKNIPVHYFATNEQKLTVHYTAEGITQPGLHCISSNFTLSKYSPMINKSKTIKKSKKRSKR